MEVENVGSLITVKGTKQSLGCLWHAEGHGTFDPTYGRVDVNKADAETHNRLLDECMLKGLDENCQVGQGGSFYIGKANGRTVIQTFLGTLVSNDTSTGRGRSRRTGRLVTLLTFRRAGKVYRGRVSDEHDLFNCRRVR